MTRPGWTTFPILPIAPDGSCSCHDPQCGDAGKHPAVKWGKNSLEGGTSIAIPPGYGIGLACGERSGVVVLDLDRKNGLDGLGALQALASKCGGEIPETLCSLTPTGGYHLIFEWPGFAVKNSASALGPGIDVRGDGGYIVLPPSPHKCGGRYAFLDPDARIAPCPAWLREILLHPPKTARKLTGAVAEKLAKRWTRSKSIATQDLGASLLAITKGEAYGEPGELDTTLFKLCREIARELPDADPTSVADLFRRSFDVCGTDPDRDYEKVVEKFTRAVADLGGIGRPEVYVTDDLPKLVDAAEQAVARAGDVYTSGAVLVRAGLDAIAPVPRAAIREAMSKGARWLRGDKADMPPPEALDGLMARASWPGLRPLLGMTEVPVMRPDGSVLDVPGYDVATSVLYHPARPSPRVPEAPTREDAIRALRVLVDPVSEFRWEKPEHLTGWLAAALTPLARNAYEGPAPLFLFDASTAGSGKSLLARLAAIVGTGRVSASSPWSSEEEERRKAITAYAIEGARVVAWDNVTGKLGGKSLCAALTEPLWRDRVLGTSTQWVGPMRLTFYASANNCELGSDMDRRVVHVRINPGVERPEERTGWRYPNVLEHVKATQPELTAAALTVLRAYAVSGQRVGFAPWGSYESWAERVVGALVWAGMPDPGGAREEVREADPETEHMRTMVREWRNVFPEPVTITAVVDRLWPRDRTWERPFPLLTSAIEALLYLREGEHVTSHRLGQLARRLRGRVFSGVRFESRIDRKTKVSVWSVV